MAAHDLAELWDAHCRFEFETRDVDATMATRPTSNWCLSAAPSERVLLSTSSSRGSLTPRTWIGCCRGIEPTGRSVEIPLVAIVQFDGDKLVHEHIYWDQASVLVQLGLLEGSGGLPIAGAETARKVLDPSLPSNTLMESGR